MDTIISIDTATVKMIRFVEEIGLSFRLIVIDEPTFLPGITLQNGGLIIDPEKLLYPGDILHEAGHLAVMPPDIRATMNGNLNDGGENHDLLIGGEMMAISWSYAACLHLGLDPSIVFHKNGYKGESETLLKNFAQGHYFGLPMLQWIGLCNEPQKTPEPGKVYYPQMLKWLRE